MCSFIFFAMPIDATSHQNLNNLGQINSQKKKRKETAGDGTVHSRIWKLAKSNVIHA